MKQEELMVLAFKGIISGLPKEEQDLYNAARKEVTEVLSKYDEVTQGLCLSILALECEGLDTPKGTRFSN